MPVFSEEWSHLSSSPTEFTSSSNSHSPKGATMPSSPTGDKDVVIKVCVCVCMCVCLHAFVTSVNVSVCVYQLPVTF